ncbi:FMN-binding protein [Microbacterium sp. VKM Ac-2870]|uniref:FMN-binding protein n=1 Tax=Microbacterium sp. VKM Ac-2870 TaxID=2783825 RepID=UPI00188A6FBD|nr:FMN-binding protein [Microbacterium sp. VKM Ac-2870]MBF4563080.1 FMN-binding protein [Microbacterium sp. VKM Ac-2870]
MKRIVYAILATVSGLVLIFSYRTSLPEQETAAVAPVKATPRAAAAAAPTPSAAASAPASAATPDAAANAAPAKTGLSDGTFSGAAANTRYGAVQVKITVSGGAITDVQTPAYPDHDSRDRQINQDALPQLISETLAAQSAAIDMISGATYTSTGYLDSLQSAIDQASA